MSGVGSLCSGYEGFGLALGIEPAWVADNDPDAARLLAHRFPGVPNLAGRTEARHFGYPALTDLVGGRLVRHIIARPADKISHPDELPSGRWC